MRGLSMRRVGVLVGVLAVGAVAIFEIASHRENRQDTQPGSAPSTATTRQVQPTVWSREVVVGDQPVNIGGIMERTHFAFEQRGGRLIGGDSTYVAELNGSSL